MCLVYKLDLPTLQWGHFFRGDVVAALIRSFHSARSLKDGCLAPMWRLTDLEFTKPRSQIGHNLFEGGGSFLGVGEFDIALRSKISA